MSKKVYFASDFHLGMDALLTSDEREKKVVNWLNSIATDAEMLFLVGDVFDYWFEYKHAVPNGFTRLLGTLGEMADAGIPIHFFTGNHDMWMFRYLTDEMGIPVYREPVRFELSGHSFLVGHGDGLGPGDVGYKLLKKVLANPVCQGAFRWIHPDIGLPLMRFFSATSRNYTGGEDAFGTENEEWLWQYCESFLAKTPVDFFIFGHRHLPIDVLLSNGESRYINLGEWMYACSFGMWDGKEFSLQFYDSEYVSIYGNKKAKEK